MGDMKAERRQSPLVNLTPNYIILGLLLLFALSPLATLFFNAFKNSSEIAHNPLGFPQAIIFSNFSNAWDTGGFSTTLAHTLVFVEGTGNWVPFFCGIAASRPAPIQLSRI